MASSEKKINFTLPLSSFEPINFVSPKTSSINDYSVVYSTRIRQTLTGKEASDFYKEVLSQESQASIPQTGNVKIEPRKKPVVKKASTITHPNTTTIKTYSKSEFLRFCEENNASKVKEVLGQGFEINSADDYGWTGLMCASCSGAEKVICVLLKYGADKHLTDSKGRTALDFAKLKKHYNIAEILANPNNAQNVSSTYNLSSDYDCSQCKQTFKAAKEKHETSIFHQLNRDIEKPKTFYNIMDNNKGFQIMLKTGWDQEKGLGPSGSGQKFPVKTILKRDRHGLGVSSKVKPRITHFQPFDLSAVANKHPPSVPKSRRLEKIRKRKEEEKERQKIMNFRREFY